MVDGHDNDKEFSPFCQQHNQEAYRQQCGAQPDGASRDSARTRDGLLGRWGTYCRVTPANAISL